LQKKNCKKNTPNRTPDVASIMNALYKNKKIGCSVEQPIRKIK
jgi:hypothetical protein